MVSNLRLVSGHKLTKKNLENLGSVREVNVIAIKKKKIFNKKANHFPLPGCSYLSNKINKYFTVLLKYRYYFCRIHSIVRIVNELSKILYCTSRRLSLTKYKFELHKPSFEIFYNNFKNNFLLFQ